MKSIVFWILLPSLIAVSALLLAKLVVRIIHYFAL